jgi:hypothetical protein
VGVDAGVDTGIGIGIGIGVGVGVVKPGDVILWEIAPAENATELELMAIVAIIGVKNNTKSMKIRLKNELNLCM